MKKLLTLIIIANACLAHAAATATIQATPTDTANVSLRLCNYLPQAVKYSFNRDSADIKLVTNSVVVAPQQCQLTAFTEANVLSGLTVIATDTNNNLYYSFDIDHVNATNEFLRPKFMKVNNVQISPSLANAVYIYSANDGYGSDLLTDAVYKNLSNGVAPDYVICTIDSSVAPATCNDNGVNAE